MISKRLLLTALCLFWGFLLINKLAKKSHYFCVKNISHVDQLEKFKLKLLGAFKVFYYDFKKENANTLEKLKQSYFDDIEASNKILKKLSTDFFDKNSDKLFAIYSDIMKQEMNVALTEIEKDEWIKGMSDSFYEGLVQGFTASKNNSTKK